MATIRTKDEVIRVLDHLLNGLDKVNSNDKYSEWKVSAVLFFNEIYGDKSLEYKKLAAIGPRRYIAQHENYLRPDRCDPGTGDISEDYIDCKQSSLTLLNACRTHVELLGVPQRNDDMQSVQNQFNIAQQQNQHQSQSIEQVIEQAVQELSKEQVERIRQIIKEGGPRATMIERVLEELKNLRRGTLASIFATILTHYFGGVG